MSSDFEIERHCAYEKKPGIVQLSGTHLLWTPDSAADGSEIRLAFSNIRQFQVSKEGSAKKAMIRITCLDRSDKITLDFARSFTDRDAVRDVLNRLQARTTAISSTPTLSTPITVDPSNTPTPPTASTSIPSPQQPKPLAPEERARRQRLLKVKEVRNLHMQLVRGGTVSDDTFWAAVKYRYKDNGEPRGRAGLEDPAAETTTVTGHRGVPSDAFVPDEATIAGATHGAAGLGAGAIEAAAVWDDVPTPAQRHVVFMQNPAVARACRDLVPSKMTTERFWQMYLYSSLAPRRTRGRISKTDTAKTAEADAILAPYQAADAETGAREVADRVRGLARELDLGRVDDHRNQHIRDATDIDAEMNKPQPGNRGAALGSSGLRLVRLVNRHGGLVLEDGGIGEWEPEHVDKTRPLEDLVIEAEKPYAKLGVEKVSGIVGRKHSGYDDVSMESIQETAAMLEDWDMNLSRFEEPVGNQDRLKTLLASMRP